MKKIILIPTSISTHHAAIAAYGIKKDDKNTHVIFMSSESTEPISCHSKDIDQFIYFSKSSNTLSEIIHVLKEHKVDLLYPIDEEIIHLCIVNKDLLLKYTHLPCLPLEESFLIAQDKWKFVQLLRKNSCNVANSMPHDDKNTLPYPFLLKNLYGNYGVGIFLIKDKSEYEKHPYSKDFFCEEYISGFDVTCNMYCKNGTILAYTIAKPYFDGDKKFTSKTHANTFYHDQKILNLATKVVDILQWNGLANLDIRYNEKEKSYIIIEMNPRFWGSMLGSIEAGVNFPYLMLNETIDKKLQTKVTKDYTFYSLTYLLKNISLKNIMRIKNSAIKYRLHNLTALQKILLVFLRHPLFGNRF